MNLDYVDIFYHHRPDDGTPIEETMGALYDIVKSVKALDNMNLTKDEIDAILANR